MLRKLSRGLRSDLSERFDDGIVFDKGVFYLAREPLTVTYSIAGLISKLGSSPDIINLPDTNERTNELLALGRLLVISMFEHQGRLRFLAPVCPDYSQESSASFYQTIGEGISPQAHAAIKSAQFIEQLFPGYGFKPQVEILVADTEDDIPEVMARCVDGNTQVYKERCLASVRAIKDELGGSPDTEVTTFTLGLDGQFRQTQYEYEAVVRRLQKTNGVFQVEIQKLGDLRRERHSKILGRKEIDYELTVRYMAQYAALGTLARKSEEPTILLNYPTPNLPFYNAATFRDPEFALSSDDLRVVPVLETVIGGKV